MNMTKGKSDYTFRYKIRNRVNQRKITVTSPTHDGECMLMGWRHIIAGVGRARYYNEAGLWLYMRSVRERE